MTATPGFLNAKIQAPNKACLLLSRNSVAISGFHWVAVKELKLSYYIGETLLFTIYTHYGNWICKLKSLPQIPAYPRAP